MKGVQCAQATFYKTICIDANGIKGKPGDPPSAAMFIATKSAGGKLSCDMDGMVKMVEQINKLLLVVLSVAIESFNAMMPTNIKLAIGYAYDFLVNFPSSLAYLMASLYFLSQEFNFGAQLCEVMGYGYYVIDALSVVTSFSSGMADANGEGSSSSSSTTS